MSTNTPTPTQYPRQGDEKSCEFWWYRQSPDHKWQTVMICWAIGVMERCGNPASFPLKECPGEWIGPINPPQL